MQIHPVTMAPVARAGPSDEAASVAMVGQHVPCATFPARPEIVHDRNPGLV
jgi:hypothetical protein